MVGSHPLPSLFPLSCSLWWVPAFFPFAWWLMAPCIARISQPWEQSPSRGCQAANSESSWMSRVPNFHFSSNYFFKASDNYLSLPETNISFCLPVVLYVVNLFLSTLIFACFNLTEDEGEEEEGESSENESESESSASSKSSESESEAS